MSELALILIGALLVNNFVLAQFLGLCPFMGMTRGYDTALAMGLATTFVLTLSATLCHALFHLLLVPLSLEWLRIVVFIAVVACVVQLTEIYLRSLSPLLHRLLGIYLPLITTNCAVLGVALIVIGANFTWLQTLVFAIGAAGGFTLVMVLFGAIRERLEGADVPKPFSGAPIALITAGIMSLGFLGFAGLAS
ncbi:MAG: electron transport complex subunit RsxA [Pseudomonadales bacterium]|nr:electron transport complex subunit RsxA [Pseudomonadales bacterium]MDP6472023.1 electron transport complex subunit RsxA [Pseudomonadales bacterium]MDP6826704.1 electron transport complex subunit RsxA [Pseudomonadales bacterium]MDP6969935.1 electron transport complex subunit RsxA [Pseudomonadales bacterium]